MELKPGVNSVGLPLGTEAQFAEDCRTIEPIIKRMSDAMVGNRSILVGQKFQIEANQQIMNRQNETLSKNREAMEDATKKAAEIINAAENRAKEIEKGITVRIAEANHKDRLAAQKLAEAEKILWEAREEIKRKREKAVA